MTDESAWIAWGIDKPTCFVTDAMMGITNTLNRMVGKHIDAKAVQFYQEKDFPQPRPCAIADRGPIGSKDARLSVANSFQGATVLITGAVGFVGSVVLEQLLRLVPGIKAIYLVVR